MRIETDGSVFDVDAEPGTLRIEVPKNGYDEGALDVVRRYVELSETDTRVTLEYALGEGEVSFTDAARRAGSRLDRLALAQKLALCLRYRSGFRVPLLHPSTVYVSGGLLRVVHCGLQGLLAPRVFDEALFLRSLQAMVLHVFRPKLAFEHLLDGAKGLRDSFSTSVLMATTPEELFAFIATEFEAERAKAAATTTRVSKGRYATIRVLGALGVAVGLVAGVLGWQADTQSRLQTAVVAAQARFLASDYSGTLAALEDHAAAALPASAKYVLAVSSIKLDDLTATQKDAILNTISEKSDDVTLNYWIAIGRGEFEQALDLAQNLGDDQLELLAYTDLYQATKLNTRLPGGEKQKLLEEYAKAIDTLTAKLSGEAGEEAGK